MSNLTRCAVRDMVAFKDAAGNLRRGVVCRLTASQALIRSRDMFRPFVDQYRWNGDTEEHYRVSNDSLWVVPFENIVENYGDMRKPHRTNKKAA